MNLWRAALARTRELVERALGRRVAGGARLSDWEEALILADVAPALAGEICARLPPQTGVGEVAAVLESLLAPPPVRPQAGQPRVVMLVGANGSGKTTSCAKLARRSAAEGRRPLLCAADTFRAAGSEQLRLWAERLGCEVVAGAPGADPAAVAFDALEAAIRRGADDLFIDTAGRMHTREPLMRELDKIRRALAKRRESAPDEVWVVLDAALGRNAVAQARSFGAVVPLTGAIVTKLDGSARGGFVFSLARDLRLPVVYAGLGEGPDDLVPFDPRRFVDGLLAPEDSDAQSRG